ncbi:MAG: hypothetical protein LUC99_00790 [Clostridiales bacterium]|nr:hypothetical protein [Clostridiales bacterium]
MGYSEKAIIQNMKDAGCGEACIREFLTEYRQGKQKNCDMVLSRHRRELLDQLHQEQRKIDCLDYLSYQMKKGGKDRDFSSD